MARAWLWADSNQFSCSPHNLILDWRPRSALSGPWETVRSWEGLPTWAVNNQDPASIFVVSINNRTVWQ